LTAFIVFRSIKAKAQEAQALRDKWKVGEEDVTTLKQQLKDALDPKRT
jgi:hypothetical protein